MQELEKILEEIIDRLKEEGCIIDDAAGKRAEEIIRKHMNGGWIPVEEKLPEDEAMMLVTCQTKAGRLSVNRAWYGEGTWHGTGTISGVIAWRPLPEPYRGEE